jgi:hypothetical protein
MKRIHERGAAGNTIAGQPSTPTVKQRSAPSVWDILPATLSRQVQIEVRHVQDAPENNQHTDKGDHRLLDVH